MTEKIQVELGDRSYPIEIGQELLPSLGEVCARRGLVGKTLLVSDSNVGPLYADTAVESLERAGMDVASVILPAGEATKCEGRLFELYDHAIEHGMNRHSFVVALGGGVVGDIAGYMAASYLRGIAFVQVPTSLLAMVDSSVGGKTAINLPAGKNLIGAFHQPRAVLADLDVLETLPPREWRAGLAEVVKYGMIADADFFAFLEANREGLLSCDKEIAARIVRRSCEIKAEVVRCDERESGLRAILNFGHTLGHAIENAAGYGEYLHGEAVAIGMDYAARLSARRAGLDASVVDRLHRLLTDLGLPTTADEFDWADLYGIMMRDKKAKAGQPMFVLPPRLGQARPGYACEEAICKEVWDG